MNSPRYFFQDFLFEDLPVDEQEYPIVTVTELPTAESDGDYFTVSLDMMLRMNKKTEWDELFTAVDGKDVCIRDDVLLENEEMEGYKQFYLKSYYYNIAKHCKEKKKKKKDVV